MVYRSDCGRVRGSRDPDGRQWGWQNGFGAPDAQWRQRGGFGMAVEWESLDECFEYGDWRVVYRCHGGRLFNSRDPDGCQWGWQNGFGAAVAPGSQRRGCGVVVERDRLYECFEYGDRRVVYRSDGRRLHGSRDPDGCQWGWQNGFGAAVAPGSQRRGCGVVVERDRLYECLEYDDRRVVYRSDCGRVRGSRDPDGRQWGWQNRYCAPRA